MKSEMVPIGDVTRALPREGQLLPAIDHKPKHAVSPRAKGFWEKLCTWYGASKMEDFGDWPPVEICRAIDALLHRDDIAAVLLEIKDTHKVWPPTTPQLEAIVRKHTAPPVDWSKMRDRLAQHVIRTRYARMSTPQRIGIPRWTWSQGGVFIPPGDGAAGFFVPFTELT